MAIRIQYRRGTILEWVATNPILAEGEPGWEIDSGKFKVGDGVTRWNLLSYSSGPSGDVASEIHATFSWGDVSSVIIGSMAENAVIHSINFVVLEVYDGSGAEVTIGTVADPDLLLSANDVDLKTIGTYLISPGYKFPADTDIKLFNTPGAGASTGNGTVVINY